MYINLFRHSISTLQRKFASGSLGSGGAWLQGHPGHLFEVGQGVAAGQIRGPPWVLYASWFHEAHRGHPQSRLTGAKRREWMGCWGLLGVAGMIITIVYYSDYGSFPHSLLSTRKSFNSFKRGNIRTDPTVDGLHGVPSCDPLGASGGGDFWMPPIMNTFHCFNVFFLWSHVT